jgi:acyl-CoA thioesterase I
MRLQRFFHHALGTMLILALAALLPLAGTHAAPAQQSARIMPLGDSITQGNADYNSYRRPLWKLLQNDYFGVDFVGSMKTQVEDLPPPNPDFDLDHEGHWGWRTDQVLNDIDAWAAAARPDIALVHLGTNDLGQGRSVTGTVDNISALITRLRTANPNITILLAKPIPCVPGSYCQSTAHAQFGVKLAALATARNSAQSRVLLIDMTVGFNPQTDLHDGLHPNISGEQKMAERWFAALQPLLQPASTGTATQIPAPTATATLRAATPTPAPMETPSSATATQTAIRPSATAPAVTVNPPVATIVLPFNPTSLFLPVVSR